MSSSARPSQVAKAAPLNFTETMVRQAFRDAVARLQQSAGGQRVLARISAQDVDGIMEELDWAGWTAALDTMTTRLGAQAANAAYDAIVSISQDLIAHFGGTMAKASARAEAGVGEHITGIDRRTRAAVRDVIAKGLQNGSPIPDISRRLQNVIGLTDGQGLALDRFEKQLVKQGVESPRIRAMSVQYRDRMLAQRGESIARYETMWASNQGRLDGYAFAAAQGAVGTDAKVQWVAADGACDECDGLNGEEITLGDTFSNGDDGPPDHPNCRCTTILSSFGTTTEE